MTSTDPTADRSYRALLAVPALPRVLVGMTISRVAGAMVSIALVVFTLSSFHSAVLAGVVTFASIMPGMLLAPIAGALLDRHGRARLVLLDYVVAACAVWLIGGLALAGRLTPELLVLIAAAASLTQPLSLAGLRSLLPILAPTHLWERANAVDSNGYVVATLIGPPVAGGLVALIGGPWTLIIIGAVFATAALVLVGMADPETDTASTGSLLLDAWQGLRYTLTNPTLRGLAVSISAANLGGGMLQIVVPVVILERLDAGPFAVGLAWALSGIAGMAGAFLFGRIDSRGHEKALLVWPQLGMAVAVAILLVSIQLPVILVAMAVMGFLNGPTDIGLFTIRQRRTDPAWMGRAFATSMALNFLGFPVGSAISGSIVEVSLPATIAFGVVALVVASLSAYRLIPEEAEAIGEVGR